MLTSPKAKVAAPAAVDTPPVPDTGTTFIASAAGVVSLVAIVTEPERPPVADGTKPTWIVDRAVGGRGCRTNTRYHRRRTTAGTRSGEEVVAL
jgi:hypothetical protein